MFDFLFAAINLWIYLKEPKTVTVVGDITALSEAGG